MDGKSDFNDVLNNVMQDLENEFYNKRFYFSYSSLNKLMWNPQSFYQSYVLDIKEERLDNHLVNGKLIHLLLLEPENFNNKFIISPISLPGDSTRKVIDRVYSHHKELSNSSLSRTDLKDYSNAILDILSDINLHQSLKTDEQRIDKILTPEAFNYWEFLKTKEDKVLISDETYKYCTTAVDIIKTNKKICELIGLEVTAFDNKEVINEKTFISDSKKYAFGFKGIIDNIVIDHDKKIIYINDIKTTSKDLRDFPESIEYYSYWMQAIMYTILVTNEYDNLIVNDYQLEFRFIVIDRLFQTYAFPVSQTTLETWLNRFTKVIEKAEWHYKNRSYELPYEFMTDSIIL